MIFFVDFFGHFIFEMSTKEINQIVDEVITLFAENNHGHACLIASVILNELLCKHGYPGNIVEGYSRYNVFGERAMSYHSNIF